MFKIFFWITETLLISFFLKYASSIFDYHCKMADSLPLHPCVLKKIPAKKMKLADNI